MNRSRFQVALRETRSGDWEKFERLASSFLASEYPDLRTTAAPAGDQGRDGILYSPEHDNTIVFQYSVTTSWENKIRSTVRRLKEEFDSGHVLTYVTNQEIGGRADKIGAKIRKDYGIFIDIRDQGWFLDRVNRDAATSAAAEELASAIVDPIMAKDGLVTNKAQALSGTEARAALVFLELQWEDVTRHKGLTRLSYEALVLAALRHTDSSSRVSREEVHKSVAKVVPNHPIRIVEEYTNAALQRLDKKSIRHWQSEDTFCLTFEESKRVRERLTEVDAADQELQKEIRAIVERFAQDDDSEALVSDVTQRARRVLEVVLLGRGEEFVSAVISNRYDTVKIDDLRDRILEDLNDHPVADGSNAAEIVSVTDEVVRLILTDPGTAIRQHLRPLADAYTLFAFLRETPDVQSAVTKLFASGHIWLDTSLLLPLFAETLLPEEERQFSVVIKAGIESGLDLHVTSGVLEEVVGHMHLCVKFIQIMSQRDQQWEGRTPYLCDQFINTGRAIGTFNAWLENFRGDVRPEDDIAQYLQESFSITRQDLEELSDAAPDALRFEVQNAWQEITEERRLRKGSRIDSNKAARLARHDVENYLGVLQRRKMERDSPMGFASWWVTLDSAARTVDNRLRNDLQFPGFVTPVMSPDFLVGYLALGPSRGRVSKRHQRALPTVIDLRLVEALPPRLLQVANSVREQNKDLAESVIRRKVRDALDKAKSREGRISTGGLDALEESLVIDVLE